MQAPRDPALADLPIFEPMIDPAGDKDVQPDSESNPEAPTEPS